MSENREGEFKRRKPHNRLMIVAFTGNSRYFGKEHTLSFRNIKSKEAAKRIVGRRRKDKMSFAAWSDGEEVHQLI